MKRIARLSCEGGTGTARRRWAMSQAARAGSQVAQWTTPSRARQNEFPLQRQQGIKSFTAVFVMAFPPRVMPPPTRGHHCSEAARDGSHRNRTKLAGMRDVSDIST